MKRRLEDNIAIGEKEENKRASSDPYSFVIKSRIYDECGYGTDEDEGGGGLEIDDEAIEVNEANDVDENNDVDDDDEENRDYDDFAEDNNSEIREVTGQIFFRKKQIGSLQGYIFRRCNNFYSNCDEISSETQHCSYMFFTEKGLLKPCIKSKVGAACNNGGYLHVERVSVDPEHRGKDLGLRLFQKALEKTVGQWTIAFIKPAPWDSRESTIPFREGITRLSQYFARLGFKQCSQEAAQEGNSFWYLEATSFSSQRILTKAQSKKIKVTLPPPDRVTDETDKALQKLVTAEYEYSPEQVDALKRQLQIMIHNGADINKANLLHFVVANEKNNLIAPLLEIGSQNLLHISL